LLEPHKGAFVIPAKAGIQQSYLGSGFRRNDNRADTAPEH
jgi:hypothetical protein